MQGRSRNLLRAFLPLLPLCLCQACGIRSGSENGSVTAATPTTVDVPAISNNAPPTIVIAAVADAQVGATFDYQPVAQDPESDTLRFTAVNLPPWASLDPTNGLISGTPGPTDEGVYESISITVADATHQIVTAPFSITVNPVLDNPCGRQRGRLTTVGNAAVESGWRAARRSRRVSHPLRAQQFGSRSQRADHGSGHHQLSVFNAHVRCLVFRGGCRQCQRPRRAANHACHQVDLIVLPSDTAVSLF